MLFLPVMQWEYAAPQPSMPNHALCLFFINISTEALDECSWNQIYNHTTLKLYTMPFLAVNKPLLLLGMPQPHHKVRAGAPVLCGQETDIL